MNRVANPGLLGKLAGFVVMGALLVLGIMFSMVLLAVAFVIGLGVFGYFWWQTRDLRNAMREQVAAHRASHAEVQGQVIEGEVVIVEERAQTKQQTLLISEPPVRQIAESCGADASGK